MSAQQCDLFRSKVLSSIPPERLSSGAINSASEQRWLEEETTATVGRSERTDGSNRVGHVSSRTADVHVRYEVVRWLVDGLPSSITQLLVESRETHRRLWTMACTEVPWQFGWYLAWPRVPTEPCLLNSLWDFEMTAQKHRYAAASMLVISPSEFKIIIAKTVFCQQHQHRLTEFRKICKVNT